MDISEIGLKDLRTKVAIIPQDVRALTYERLSNSHYLLSPFCSAVRILASVQLIVLMPSPGTIRSNLDPFSMYDDPRLWDALRRSCLVEPIPTEEVREKEQNKTRYTLDSIVEGDGANLSVGERSLLSLARALVKDSKVVGK